MGTGIYARAAGWFRSNRNLALFIAMMIIIVMLPAFEDTNQGELLFAVVNISMIAVAVALNGRSSRLFWLALVLSLPALGLRMVALVDDRPGILIWSWVFSAAVFVVTTVRLLGDVFAPGRVTRDRLFACATTYLVIGLLWCFLYSIVVEVSPGSFTGLSVRRSLHVADLAYFSFNVVTSVALTPILPASKAAQMLVILQEFASVLYMAFVISRLVGVYAPDPAQPPPQGPPPG